MDNRNFTLLTDLYELTMAQGYFKCNRHENVIFDAFYRVNPSNGGYSICCGLNSIIDYIKNFKFEKDDIDYLRTTNLFDEDFLQYLSTFKFTGDIYAIPEGSVIHPMEPLVKVIAPIDQAQLVETTILNFLNHQSLIATKASRVCYAAKNDAVMEFGLRRAQGPDAGTLGARAAVIGGCAGTSNVLCAKQFGLLALGTHAHSWIMSFEDEYTAFKTYAELYPMNATLLVDTYDTLKSGVPNAIRVFKELRNADKMPLKYGIRLDSGDLAYLSKKAKKMLDEAGFTDAIICASSDLAAVEINGEFVPKIKLSENSIKITNPGNKTVYRIYDNNTNKAIADLICFADEKIDGDLTLFSPTEPWKKTKLREGTYYTKEILVPIFKNGKCVYDIKTTNEIKEFCKNELDSLWDECKRFENPHSYYVDLSQKLYNTKMELLEKMSNN